MPIRYINPLPNPIQRGINVDYFDRKALERQKRHDQARALYTEQTQQFANQPFLDQAAREQFLKERDESFQGVIDSNAGNLSKGFHDVLGAIEQSALHPYSNLSKRLVEQNKAQQALQQKYGDRFINQGQGLDQPLYSDGQWADPSSIQAGGIEASQYEVAAQDLMRNLKAQVTSGQLDLTQSSDPYYLQTLIYGDKVLTKDDILKLSSDPLVQQVFRSTTTANSDTRTYNPSTGETYAQAFSDPNKLANFIAGANLSKIQDDHTRQVQFKANLGRAQQDRYNLAKYKSKLKKQEIDYQQQFVFDPNFRVKEDVGKLSKDNYTKQKEKYNAALVNKDNAVKDSNKLAFEIFRKNNVNLKFDPNVDYSAALNATRDENGNLNLSKMLNDPNITNDEANALKTYFDETNNSKIHWENIVEESAFGKANNELNDQIWNEFTDNERNRYGTKEQFEELSNRDRGVASTIFRELGVNKPDIIKKLEKDKNTNWNWWDLLEFIVPGVQAWDEGVEQLRQLETYNKFSSSEKQEVKDWLLGIGKDVGERILSVAAPGNPYSTRQNINEVSDFISTVKDEMVIQNKKNELLDKESVNIGISSSVLSNNPKSAYNYIPKLFTNKAKANKNILGGFKTSDEAQLSALQVPLKDDPDKTIADILYDEDTKINFSMAGASGIHMGGANLVMNVSYGPKGKEQSQSIEVNVGDANINSFVAPLVGELNNKLKSYAGTYDGKRDDIEKSFTDVGMIKGGQQLLQRFSYLTPGKEQNIRVPVDGNPNNTRIFKVGKQRIEDGINTGRFKDIYYIKRKDANGSEHYIGTYDNEVDARVDAANTYGKIYTRGASSALIPNWKYNDKYVRKLKK